MAAGIMRSSKKLGVFAMVVVLLAALLQLHSVTAAGAAAGKTSTVNWTYPYAQNFFTHWNKGTAYVVGDRIRFLYNNKYHNVVRVTEEEYQSCTSKAVPHTNGDTVFHLNHPGRFYFICTHPLHCAAGMKVSVRVNEA